jgi:hypothetical protein
VKIIKLQQLNIIFENDTNYTKTRNIFKCFERSLKRWIERYEELEVIKILKPINQLRLSP